MPLKLSKEQIDDLRDIHLISQALQTEFVIIGATAYQLYFSDENRFTADIDTVISLDMDEFSEFSRRLEEKGWKRDPKHEHRWRSRRGAYFDILPAGPKLRRKRQIVWPESGFAMNLAGFDHVFKHAMPHQIDHDFAVKAIPPHVLALTKIISFMDDPQRREKDLRDIRNLIGRYEEGSDRIFDDVVLAANLPDIGLANAFLLGLDLAKLCTAAERSILNEFIERFEPEEDEFTGALESLKKGFANRV